MIKAVLFDLDDTLLKTVEIVWEHHRATAREFCGFELTDDELKEHWGKPFSELLAQLYRGSRTVDELKAAYESSAHRFQKLVFDDSVSTVEVLLSRDVSVGVLTSARTAHANRDLSRLGFHVDQFFCIQGEEMSTVHKPNPLVFNRPLNMLSNMGIAVDNVAYVGDSPMDVGAALGAGLQFVGVTTGIATEADLRAHGAEHVVPRLSDILPILAA